MTSVHEWDPDITSDGGARKHLFGATTKGMSIADDAAAKTEETYARRLTDGPWSYCVVCAEEIPDGEDRWLDIGERAVVVICCPCWDDRPDDWSDEDAVLRRG